ncbi:hypothetical protein Lal_00020847 [Lupinus albus]|nr:hypothetical protein Lal_00020847 [Lupinus albus]
MDTNGKLTEPNNGWAEVDIPEKLFILDFDNPIVAIVSNTYLNLQHHYKDEQFMQSKAILASTIEIVDQINEYVLSIILAVNIPTPEFLNSLSTSDLPNHKIKLKVGTPIMFLRNLDHT